MKDSQKIKPSFFRKVKSDFTLDQVQEHFLMNPLLRSSLVHWACTLDEKMFNFKRLKQMMIEIQGYPECPNNLNRNRTAVHEASING